MTEIPEERLKRFWEWCGLVQMRDKRLGYKTPDGELSFGTLDLNNLFKWAVPKLKKEGFSITLYYLQEGSHPEDSTLGKWTAAIGMDDANIAVFKSDEAPTTALFLAIERLIEEGK